MYSGWPSPVKSATPTTLQPAGRVGPNRPELKTLLLRYQTAVCRVPELNRRKSGWPSPLKSATPTTLQPAGTVGPNRPELKTLLLRYQTAVWCVTALERD